MSVTTHQPRTHTPTFHADGSDEWATCDCGWTSSIWSDLSVEAQAAKHTKIGPNKEASA